MGPALITVPPVHFNYHFCISFFFFILLSPPPHFPTQPHPPLLQTETYHRTPLCTSCQCGPAKLLSWLVEIFHSMNKAFWFIASFLWDWLGSCHCLRSCISFTTLYWGRIHTRVWDDEHEIIGADYPRILKTHEIGHYFTHTHTRTNTRTHTTSKTMNVHK